MPSPEALNQLFDTQDLEIHVPPEHSIQTKAQPEPQEESLFDPTNVEPVDSPQSVEVTDELPGAIDLDKYDPLEGIVGISSTQKARVETLMRVNGSTLENALISVFGDAKGRELLAEAGKTGQAKHAQEVHKSGGQDSNVLMRVPSQSPAQHPRVRQAPGYDKGGTAKRVETNAYSPHPPNVREMWADPKADAAPNSQPSS